MKYFVEFMNLEEDDNDIIVSFAISDDKLGIKSLILSRTFLFENFLDEDERGVKVSLEGDEFENCMSNTLQYIKITEKEIKVKSTYATYCVDIAKIEKADIVQLTKLLEKQNFDHRFELVRA